MKPCSECDGRGRVPCADTSMTTRLCDYCKGEGRVEEKIFSDEIERLEKAKWKEELSREYARHDIACLRRMKQLYPCADYAVELYRVVTSMVEEVSCQCAATTSGKHESAGTCVVCKAQSLIKKVKEKK